MKKENKLRQLIKKYREIIAYLFWGVMTTIVSWGSYSLLILIFQGLSDTNLQIFGKSFSLTIVIANTLSWILAVAFAFVTNKIRVFKSKSWKRKVVIPELIKFLSSRIATGIIEIIAVPALVAFGLNQTVFGIEGMVAKVIVSFLIVILNYILSKFLVFKTKDANAEKINAEQKNDSGIGNDPA